MSHIALARKWRPQRFEDVIGQRGTIETLKNAIETGRIAPSFIFSGPRGVGKTTTARILARALNCVKGPTAAPCGKCDACIEIAEGRDVDVFEIDGATYTGVDAVREVIIEPLGMAPMRDRFKIFIIDEVHRLSKHAFDALLKSIEEPPSWVRFMMATTDLHSVPATIQSRSQVFELKALPFSAIRDQLRAITKNEKVEIDDAALALVARSAEGSMRDGLSALDQVLAFTSERVTSDSVTTVLGLIGRDVQFDIAEIVAREDVAAAFTVAGTVVEAGFDLRIVCRELARLVRDMMVVKIDPSRLTDPEIASESERDRLKELASRYSREDLMRAFDLLSRAEFEIRSSSQPRHAFEMSLVKWIHLRQLTPLTEVIERIDKLGGAGAGVPGRPGAAGAGSVPRPSPTSVPPARPSTPPASPSPSPMGPRMSAPAPAPSATSGGNGTSKSGSAGQPIDIKALLLSSVKDQNKVFYGMVIAQAQRVDVEGDTIAFTFASVHKSLRAQLDGKRSWMEHLAQSIAGRKITVVAREGQPATPAAQDPAAAAAAARQAELRARAKAQPEVQTVLDVFGGEIEDVEELDKK
jgi:DNA polymerase-3 subunit gamma/tau